MKEFLKKHFTFSLIFILFSSCSFSAVPAPTSTTTATFTLEPTSTETPAPTPVPPTATPEMKRIELTEGGLSVQVSTVFDTELKGNTLNISDKSTTLVVSFTGADYDASTHTLKNVIDGYLDALSARGGVFNRSEPASLIIDGIEGVYVDLTGTLFDAPIEGMAIAVSPYPDFAVFGLAFSNLSSDDQRWKKSGGRVFQDLLDSIRFLPAKRIACKISADKTYGYTMRNPIKVGGDALHGPERERAYLDNLRGPKGEILAYNREGSSLTDTTILDGYRITGGGLNKLIYIDEYNYEAPAAPFGFTCAGPFPLPLP